MKIVYCPYIKDECDLDVTDCILQEEHRKLWGSLTKKRKEE